MPSKWNQSNQTLSLQKLEGILKRTGCGKTNISSQETTCLDEGEKIPFHLKGLFPVFWHNRSSVSNQWKLPSALCRDKEILLTAQLGVEYFWTFVVHGTLQKLPSTHFVCLDII